MDYTLKSQHCKEPCGECCTRNRKNLYLRVGGEQSLSGGRYLEQLRLSNAMHLLLEVGISCNNSTLIHIIFDSDPLLKTIVNFRLLIRASSHNMAAVERAISFSSVSCFSMEIR